MKFDKKYLLALLPLALVSGLLYYFSDIATYVVLAWALSMVGAPIVMKLRKYLGKNVAAGITVGLFVLLIGLILWIFIPPLLQQAKNLTTVDYNKMIGGLEQPINDWNQWLVNRGLMEDRAPKITEVFVEPILEKKPIVATKVIPLDSLLNDSTKVGTNIALVINIDNEAIYHEQSKLDNVAGDEDGLLDIYKGIYEYFNPSIIPSIFSSFVGFFGNILVAIMSILFIAFFFLKEQGLFNNMITSILPNKYEGQTFTAINQSSKLLIRYFVGVVVQIMIITIFVSLALSILGVKNALLIGFFAALMNIIPYIGPILGASFAVLITLSSNLALPFYDEMLPLLFKVMGVFMVMQLLDNFILQPNIFSKSVKAHPLEIFIVVLMGAKIGGIIGMVVAIPIYTVLRVLAKVFLSEFKVVQSITKGI
ncbi:AI-2E family transporter [Saprospiraceae bacterium]|mgnify:FL=1|nr:AI-2E family transporter [Saprospiraceae bacterium]MDA9263649.1 AI-2E family transporter [Saprospiraceae bacterium]MDA9358550.1 AI-2E family transporter [Saprospiraceae bacterium]MDB4163329.1 AI-2E family transporter [Saprospiraceae bacterium]HCV50559.1 AI-2E family transporter [Saprospirales bacterium]